MRSGTLLSYQWTSVGLMSLMPEPVPLQRTYGSNAHQLWPILRYRIIALKCGLGVASVWMTRQEAGGRVERSLYTISEFYL